MGVPFGFGDPRQMHLRLPRPTALRDRTDFHRTHVSSARQSQELKSTPPNVVMP